MMDEQKKEYREPELRVYGELRQLCVLVYIDVCRQAVS